MLIFPYSECASSGTALYWNATFFGRQLLVCKCFRTNMFLQSFQFLWTILVLRVFRDINIIVLDHGCAKKQKNTFVGSSGAS